MKTKRVSVLLQTNKPVKAFLLNNFGPEPMIDSRHIFHNYLLLCLNHTLTFKNCEVPGYPDSMKIYISKIDYERHGCWLQPRQTQMFNLHVDFYMKALLIAYTDTYLKQSVHPQLNDALRFALEQMKLSELDWDIDTITKYYYRHRQRTGKPLLYNKPKKSFIEVSDFKTA